jgi:HAD superfamily hydrolase (TIGR01549 family)
MLRACAFDLGNTLVPDMVVYQGALAEFASILYDRGIVDSQEQFCKVYTAVNRRTRTPFVSHTYGEEVFFEEALGELGVDSIRPKEALEEYRRVLMARMEVAPAIVAAIEYVRERGLLVALLSNESTARVRAFFHKTGLRDRFDEVLVSEAVGYEKPDLRIFREALRRLAVEPHELAMVGDNAVADGACRKLGILFALATQYRKKEWAWEVGDAHRPDYVMERIDPATMADFLESAAGDNR